MILNVRARRLILDRQIVEMLTEGKGINAIMRELRVGKSTIRQIREMAQRHGYLDGSKPIPVYPEAVFPERMRAGVQSGPDKILSKHLEWIKERLEAGWHLVSIYEELPAKVARSSFYRFIERHGLSEMGAECRKRVVPEIVEDPGESLQLDWGLLRTFICPETGKKRKVWALVGVLGHSRYMMVRLVISGDFQTTMIALESMFREIGGVPKRVTTDNPKIFSLEASKYEAVLNPAFVRFSAHYGFRIECLPAATPELKGKVERQMNPVRRLYETHGPQWDGLQESQDYLDKKLVRYNERTHGTTRKVPIQELIMKELASLKSLPPLAYEREEISEARVRADGHVRFNNKYYSVEDKHIGKSVVVLGNSRNVSIYHNGTLLEVHERLLTGNRTRQTKEFHRKPWERILTDHGHYLERAQKIGPDCKTIIEIILSSSEGFVDTRIVWGILDLAKVYDRKDVEVACGFALSTSQYTYHPIRNHLQLHATPKDKEDSKPTHTFARQGAEYEAFVQAHLDL